MRSYLTVQEKTDAEVKAAAEAFDPDTRGRDRDGESQIEHARDRTRAAESAARNARAGRGWVLLALSPGDAATCMCRPDVRECSHQTPSPSVDQDQHGAVFFCSIMSVCCR